MACGGIDDSCDFELRESVQFLRGDLVGGSEKPIKKMSREVGESLNEIRGNVHRRLEDVETRDDERIGAKEWSFLVDMTNLFSHCAQQNIPPCFHFDEFDYFCLSIKQNEN